MSQRRKTLSIGGANLGGATITQEPAAVKVWPPTVKVAVTGPSDTSSCHSSLSPKLPSAWLDGDPEFPKPPRTSSRPSSSVRISPSGTVVAAWFLTLNVPVSNTLRWSGPLSVREPGSMIRPSRSAPE
jgi:hypothetical protein